MLKFTLSQTITKAGSRPAHMMLGDCLRHRLVSKDRKWIDYFGNLLDCPAARDLTFPYANAEKSCN